MKNTYSFSAFNLVLFFLLLFVSSNEIVAQGNPAASEENLRRESYLEQNIVIPASPQAASLGKYGNINVSHYTGSVNFGLGIHTIQGKNLQLPISLSYTGNGNKVSDLPSWVGLGWDLQAGGVVTRSTQGDPDLSHNYFNQQSDIDDLHYNSDINEKYDHMEEVLRFEMETQPDIYFYNLPGGHSGKFYITPSKEVVFKEKKGLVTIQVFYAPDSDIDKFIFMDDTGKKYTLDKRETTYYHTDDDIDAMGNGTPPREFTYTSSWHLTEISTPESSEKIELSYSYLSEPFQLPPTNYSFDTYTYSTNRNQYSCGGYICGDFESIQLGGSYSLLEVKYRRYLEEIKLIRNSKVIEEVNFHTTTYTRNWGTYSYRNKRLDSISVKKTPDLKGDERTHTFTYYCEAGSQNCSDPDVNRLTLKSYGSPNMPSGSEYLFEYNSTNLPDVLSNKIDHWGYYNNNSGSSLVPSVDLCGLILPGGYANRETSSSRVQAGMLEKIQYPTGGYSEMTYEPHMVEDWRNCGGGYNEIAGGGVRIKKIEHFSDGSNTPAYSQEYRYENSINRTTGILMRAPDYTRNSSLHTSESFGQGGNVCTVEMRAASYCPKVIVGASSMAPLGTVQGSYVGYSTVEEINAGKTVYHYHNDELQDSPFDDYENGNLDVVEVYDDAGDILAKTEYTYDFDNDLELAKTYASVKVVSETFQSDERLCIQANGDTTWVNPQQLSTFCPNGTIRTVKTRLKTELISLRQRSFIKTAEKTTQYFYDASKTLTGTLVKEKEFEYDNKQTRNPTAIEFTDSRGETRRTEISYSQEVFEADNSDPSGGVLLLNGIKGVPIVTDYYVDGSRIYSQRTMHSSNSPAGGVTVEKLLNRFQGSSNRLREEVEERDEHANIIQARTLENQPVAYLWNYHGSRMIASIQNATVDQCAFTSFENYLDHGGWTASNSGKDYSPYHHKDEEDAKAGLRFTKAMSLTKSNLPTGNYIVSYWTKSPSSVYLNIGSEKRRKTMAADADGWYYVELVVGASSGTIKLGISTSCDEVRLYPADAIMTTYTYERDHHRLLATGDSKGSIQRFEYDTHNRLTAIRDYENNFIKYVSYHFGDAGNYVNRVTEKSPLVDNIRTETTLNGLTSTDRGQSNAFVDGLGRPLQQTMVGESPSGKDVIVPVIFDNYGRQVKEYLPYTATTNGGNYRTGAISSQQSYYSSAYGNSNGNKAYTLSEKELSPLSRPTKNKIPGHDFHLHPTEITYRTNTHQEVRDFNSANAYFPTNSLLVIETTDGDGRIMRQYITKSGRTIREDRGDASTYSLYDGVGNFVQIIQPEGAKSGHDNPAYTKTSSLISANSYDYDFDPITNLLSSNRRPGEALNKATEYWYDRLERPVLIEHPDGIKEFTKYDILNRPVITGIYTGTSLPTTSNGLYESESASGSYGYTTNQSFPTNGLRIHTVSHFDDYDFDGNNTEEGQYTSASGYSSSASIMTRGLPTRTLEAVLPDNGAAPTEYLETLSFYDDRGRIILTDAENHLDGSDLTWTNYDFIGRTLKSRQVHTSGNGSTGLTVNQRWEYDHRMRVKEVYHQIGDNGPEQLLAKYSYDEWSREKQKRLAGHSPFGFNYNYAQTLDFQYNINGWLTAINTPYHATGGGGSTSDLFFLKLNYNSGIPTLNADAQYTGNISSVEWKYDINSDQVHTYGMTYDDQGRLTQAKYARQVVSLGNPSGNWSHHNRYNVDNITYDRNGNIQTLDRRGKDNQGGYSLIDELHYTYHTTIKDQLTHIRDEADVLVGHMAPNTGNQSFTYNDRGTLTAQANRGLTSIVNNHLNLPRQLVNSSGTHRITYGGSGNKLTHQPAGSGDRRDYLPGLEYIDNALTVVYHEEGRAVKESGQWKYEYVIRDHLGNNRVRFRTSGSTPQVREQSDYYPFGMENSDLGSPNVGGEDFLRRYNGKELIDDIGLYDYGARWYDPAIAKWNAVDPLADSYAAWSPYNYVMGNPIANIDPDGRSTESTIVQDNKDGTYTVTGGDATDGDNGVYVDDGSGGKGEKVGETVTPYSFFFDDLTAVEGAVIDMNSTEAQDFLDGLRSDNPSVKDYMAKGKGLCEYDCKTLGMDQTMSGEKQKQYKYRGSVLSSGKIASARDAGNMGAGWISGSAGIPWIAHRAATDALETKQRTGNYINVRPQESFGGLVIRQHREGAPTVSAQRVGYRMGVQSMGGNIVIPSGARPPNL